MLLMKILVLIDGEHYPPVTRDTVLSIGPDVKAAVFMGGTEKIGSVKELTDYIALPLYSTKTRSITDIINCIVTACEKHDIQQVIDLSDEPVVDYAARFCIASVLMKEDIQYKGSDFCFTPPHLYDVLSKPSMMVIGTAKRVGKTAISGYIARTLKSNGYTPCIVTMGRGGPAEPEIVRGDKIELTPSYLVKQADAGKHAASDHWENALTSRVITVGCRRCGGGMAGAPFTSNTVEGAITANDLDTDFVIMEGSGITLPSVKTDTCVVVVGAHQSTESIEKYFGPFRILIADLAIVMMCEEPMASPEKVETMEKVLDKIHPGIKQAHCVFRPIPLGSIKGRKVALVTTAPPAVLERNIVPYLEETYNCEIVGASPHLSNRPKVRKDLEHFLPAADLLLTEVKASSIDVATREALNSGIEVVYMDNVPHLVGGTVKNVEKTLIQLAQLAQEVSL
ncbi:MAG: 2,3-diphosphoglycerate synthetase [Theionarchaea archaeon]|nr:2,3-diphosphoglycerate synthetase [Theionarchaea archaeon]